MSNNLMAEWALTWGIPQEALDDLEARQVMFEYEADGYNAKGSEAYTQSMIRLAAPTAGYTLWRNNVGALPDKRGRIVRFGLANDSKAMNLTMKSADLIGWQTKVVTPEMVGSKVAIFTSIECKKADWQPGEDADREKAQGRWCSMVLAAGGIACITTGELPK